MKTSTKMMTASAVVACGFAAPAASASAAYSIDPPSTAFTGTDITDQTFKIGATGPTVTCTNASFTGTTAASGATVGFLAAFTGTGSMGSCPAGVLGNVLITVHNNWSLTVTAGGPSPASFEGKVAIPAGSSVTIKPLTVPSCTISISDTGNSNITGVTGVNTSPTGVRLYGSTSGITYTATSGCPGVASGTRADAVYNTGGTAAAGGVSIPGLTITGP